MNATRSHSVLRPAHIPNPQPIQSGKTAMTTEQVLIAVACLSFFPLMYLVGSFISSLF